MPLTSKGEKIKSAMEEEYGQKKGESVFYASKNAGKISGVDEMPSSSETPASVPSNSTGSMSSGETSMPQSNAMSGLPTLDKFRKQFRDLVGAGMPLSKCLDLGSVWNGSNSGATNFLSRDAFRKAFKDAKSQGRSVSAALKFATDAVGASSTVNGKTTGYSIQTDNGVQGAGQGATMLDARKFFRGAMRDALKSGKGYRDALGHAVTQYDGRKK